jgi:large subunit ribosomal protein L15
MNLSDVKKIKVRRKYRMRVGRGLGSGKGKTAGRGTKGQKSRAGQSRRWGHEGGQTPLYRRLPKRGFNNARFSVEYEILNLKDLAGFEPGATVDLAAARKAGLVPKTARRLKVLGQGVLDRALTVRAHKFSAKARAAIAAAGGAVEEIA